MRASALILALAGLLLAGCETPWYDPGDDPGTITTPTLPTLPTVDPASCQRLNMDIWRIEAAKVAAGRYGEGEKERLDKLTLAAAIAGCLIEPFDPSRPPVPAA